MPKSEHELPLDDSPSGLARRWRVELEASEKDQERWKTRARDVLKQYLDEREGSSMAEQRLNLFFADVQLKMASMYGNLPKVEVTRKNLDAADDVARVAAEELDRLLNCDIEKGSDNYATVLLNCLEDWHTVGFAIAKVRYNVETEIVPAVPAQTEDRPVLDPVLGVPTGETQQVELAPAVPEHERKTREEVGVDYFNWDAVRWSPCRVWEECRWIAYEVPMSRRDCVKFFGKDIGNAIALDYNMADRKESAEEHEKEVTGRARIWEIWCKEGWSDEHSGRKVYYYSESYPTILKVDDDPLKLEGFFPSPKPLAANTTTRRFVPVPDYYFAQDLYRGCDRLYSRICLLEQALAVRGVYDKNNKELATLLSESLENTMTPISNWAAFSEKGGFKAALDWVPLEQIANTLAILSQKLSEKIQLLFQTTGMSDIQRGSATQPATATEQAIKAEYGSIRTKRKQSDFSRFAADLLKLKGEIISKHFDPESIVKYSNMEYTPDAQLAMPGAQLIKEQFDQYRIEIKPEQISMPDMAAIKQEKIQLLQTLAQLFQAMGQLSQGAPELVPALLEQAKQAIAAFRGASTSEGVMDQAMDAWQQRLMAPKPDPAMQAAQMKAQVEQQKAQMDMQKTQLETQADLQVKQADTQAKLMNARTSMAQKMMDFRMRQKERAEESDE